VNAQRRDVLTVDGMFCAACAASVEAVLARQPGVASASVNFAADAAVVEWQPGAHDTAPLLAAVRGLGYDTRLIGDEADSRPPAGDPGRDLGLRLIVALFFGMWAMLPSIVLYLDVVTDPRSRYGLALAAGVFSLPVVLYAGLPFYRMGIATLRHGIAGIDALVTVGVAGSLVLSATALLAGSAEVYFEVAVALVTLQLIARLLDLRVRRKARDAVVGLLELAPTTLTLVDAEGGTRRAVLKEVAAGDTVRVGPGERVAVDGRIVSGRARIDRSLLTGESDPVTLGPDEAVHAGERVIDGACDLSVTASAGRRATSSSAKFRTSRLAKETAAMIARSSCSPLSPRPNCSLVAARRCARSSGGRRPSASAGRNGIVASIHAVAIRRSTSSTVPSSRTSMTRALRNSLRPPKGERVSPGWKPKTAAQPWNARSWSAIVARRAMESPFITIYGSRRSAISSAIAHNPLRSASRITGTIRPCGVSTAIPMWT